MTSKLSLYIDRFQQDGQDKAALTLQENGVADLAASRPTVIKIQNNVAQAKWIRANYPNILVVLRDTALEEVFEDRVTLEDIGTGRVSPDHAANLWFQTFRPQIEAAGAGVVWCVAYCEPSKTDIDALNLFYMSIMKLGVPVAIGAFSNEFNLYDVEDRFKGALDMCQQKGYYLELHGYDNLLPAPGGRQLVNSPWLYPHKLLKYRGKIIYGERGIDNVMSENRFCPGWKHAGIDEQAYANFLIAVEKEDRKDPRVIGSCVFISTRNVNDTDKSDYATSFRREGKKGQPVPPCVDDFILQYNYSILGDAIPGVPGPVDPPPPDPQPTGSVLVKVVNAGVLNVRSGPGTTYAIVGQLPGGLQFYVDSPYNSWAKVSGVSGHVSASYIQRI